MESEKTDNTKSFDLRDDAPSNERSAGILLHITSLPSLFGIGDFGPEARSFADFLHRSGQKYWQILPLNPTDISPYSAHSSLAGHTLLISPEWFLQYGFLEEEDIIAYTLPVHDNINIEEAIQVKTALFKKAYRKYLEFAPADMEMEFQIFCEEESHWLTDFGLYTLLKKNFQSSAWFAWPLIYKMKDLDALTQFSIQHKEALEEVKWLQYIFIKQWNELKTYCHSLGIKMYGDLPMYVSYDSADVWSQPEIFSLDSLGNITGIAGVPPDYFSETGQLWGMPVFRWNVLKEQNYKWWKNRIKKNLDFYNLIRLDHFRAFADYWEVPADEITAINGIWKDGPGSEFFQMLQAEFGALPFVAEDLGEMDQKVYDLRNEFDLPGMKILQFAFSQNMAKSNHIPHNYRQNFIAYTGTHDNNTTVGWYRHETGHEDRQRMEAYTGKVINEDNVHLIFGAMCYASVAKICILPMQDVLGLDERYRFNTPGTLENNWVWRMKREHISNSIEDQLKNWVIMYNRS